MAEPNGDTDDPAAAAHGMLDDGEYESLGRYARGSTPDSRRVLTKIPISVKACVLTSPLAKA